MAFETDAHAAHRRVTNLIMPSRAFHESDHSSRVGLSQGDTTRPDPTRPVRLENLLTQPELTHDVSITRDPRLDTRVLENFLARPVGRIMARGKP